MIKQQATSEAAAQSGEVVASEPVVVAHETGLHARPAALLAMKARTFTSDIRLHKGERDANARSVVAIMALEVMKGDRVHVTARGPDAQAAVSAMTGLLSREIEPPPAVAPTAVPTARVPVPVEGMLQGVPVSPGLAAGTVFHWRRYEAAIPEQAGDPQHERRELDAALAKAHLQLEALQERVAVEADDYEAGIFDAHQQMLADPSLLNAAHERIQAGASAAFAWREAFIEQANRLSALDNPVFAARAADIRDIGRRVLHLLVDDLDVAQRVPPGCIIVAEELTPSETAALDRARVRGICLTGGSPTSHAAILARAFGIPAMAGTDPRVLDLPDGTRVILDGDKGLLNPRPTHEQEAGLQRELRAHARRHAADLRQAHEPAITTDGRRIAIVANIGSVEEAAQLVELGGEGVGLLRTELLFMEHRDAPDEDEQAHVYRAIAEALGRDRILIMRCLDVGGDKPLPFLPVSTEANPFLGERGIRLLLHRLDVLRTQLRAMLTIAQDANLAIMFPMISTMTEWQEARAALVAEAEQLGVRVPAVGIMVETASAALLADHFAVDADFFSIGTNDLTQYTLAMDRLHPRLAPYVDALHPAVLRLIEHTVRGAAAHGRRVGVCGALASDPQAVPVLIGLGVQELSVSVPAIPAIKARVRGLELRACRQTAQRALAARTAREVRALIIDRHGEA